MNADAFRRRADNVFAALGMTKDDCGDTYAAALDELSVRFSRLRNCAEHAALAKRLAEEARQLAI